MFVVLITRLRQKVLKGLRLVFALAVLAILVVQLVNLVKCSGLYDHEKVPSGNPMRVQAPVIEVSEDDRPGLLDRAVEQVVKYYRHKT